MVMTQVPGVLLVTVEICANPPQPGQAQSSARLLTMLGCGSACLSHNNQMITAARILFNFGQMLPFLN